MTNPNELNVNINPDELQKVMKKYKKLKKYMKSSLFEIKKLDGNEEVISKLLDGVEDIVESTENQNWLLIPNIGGKFSGKILSL